MAPAGVSWPPEEIRIPQIQALILRGFGSLKASLYLALRIDAGRGARAWLREIAWLVSTAATPVASRDWHLNVAFTYSGLERLGLPAAALAGFRSAFIDGPAAPEHRSRALGDVGASAPESWDWGNAAQPIDVALLLFARGVDDLAGLAQRELGRLGKYGLSVVGAFEGHELPGRKEHFGFRDGISQPALRNANPAERRPGVLEPDRSENTVEPGEFLFGYRNQYGSLVRGPEVDRSLDPENHLCASATSPTRRDFASDGSFLVWRQLEQHVHEFWRAIAAQADEDRASRRKLAAKFLGRWPSGAPLAAAPEIEDFTLEDENDFGYVADDPHGFRTPFGSHIRRANPRDWHLASKPKEAIRVAKAHRIIRRGRPYGDPVAASMDPEDILRTPPDRGERGLHFLGFMADIERQFELIQGTWLNGEKFGRLDDELDPMVGATPANRGAFTIQATPIRQRLLGLARFVTVRGAAYLFMPSLRALHFLGALPG